MRRHHIALGESMRERREQSNRVSVQHERRAFACIDRREQKLVVRIARAECWTDHERARTARRIRERHFTIRFPEHDCSQLRCILCKRLTRAQHGHQTGAATERRTRSQTRSACACAPAARHDDMATLVLMRVGVRPRQ